MFTNLLTNLDKKKVNEYNEEILQVHTADQTMACWGIVTEHYQQSQDLNKTIKVKQPFLSRYYWIGVFNFNLNHVLLKCSYNG